MDDTMYLPEHSHCLYCGNPVDKDSEFCDDDCKELYIAREHEEKVKDIKFYAMIGISLVAVLIVGVIIKTVL